MNTVVRDILLLVVASIIIAGIGWTLGVAIAKAGEPIERNMIWKTK